ncbi:MAG: MoaD/ThiS family protein [Hyphomonadaceae bacterium]|nr:MoaD/ThiS family protein [Hyphomonadaceae bacterium]
MTKILFFGRLRDAAGLAELSCCLPQSLRTVAEVRQWLGARDPNLGQALAAPGVRVAVDQTFCASEQACAAGAQEIAFMSPLSGG